MGEAKHNPTAKLAKEGKLPPKKRMRRISAKTEQLLLPYLAFDRVVEHYLRKR